MKNICLYFRIHQPNRLKKYTFFDIGKDRFYEDDHLNGELLGRISDKCYLPANRMFRDLIAKYGKDFQFSMSLSGVFLEQAEAHRPDVLNDFKSLYHTGNLDLIGSNYYNSLAYIFSKNEFKRQVKLHEKKLMDVFGHQPKVFRNTGLIYFNELAAYVEKMGYKGILSEEKTELIPGGNPNFLFKSPNVKKIKTLVKNAKLTHDITFKFNDNNWSEYPLSGKKYAQWVSDAEGDIVNIFMDYETLGEHLEEHTGIFHFFYEFICAAIENHNMKFITCTKAVKNHKVKHTYDCHNPISWADEEKDLSAWLGNGMQQEAAEFIYDMEDFVIKSKNKDLIHTWSKLQTEDHLYYLCTKFFNNDYLHNHISPYNSPYDGYIYLMNALADLKITIEMLKKAEKTAKGKKKKKKSKA